METKLNTEMLVVVGPMGRDLAAFAYPADALAWAAQYPHQHHFRTPLGVTLWNDKAVREYFGMPAS